MQISITGATGFIGKRLVRYHEEKGDIVHILSRQSVCGGRKNTLYFQQDLSKCDSSDLKEFLAGSDVVYHCAAELRDESKMHDINLLGTQKLFIAADSLGVRRWVQLSSVGVYGRPKGGIVNESYTPNPQNEYERSKLEADVWLQTQSISSKVELVLLRPSTVFASDMPNQWLFQLIRAIQLGRFFYIGSKQTQLNYVHADDVTQALILCGKSDQASGQIYIVSEQLDLEQFVGIVTKQFDCNKPSLVIPEILVRWLAKMIGWFPLFPLTTSRIDALTNQCVFSDEHIRKQLNYVPKVTLELGLELYISDLRSRGRL